MRAKRHYHFSRMISALERCAYDDPTLDEKGQKPSDLYRALFWSYYENCHSATRRIDNLIDRLYWQNTHFETIDRTCTCSDGVESTIKIWRNKHSGDGVPLSIEPQWNLNAHDPKRDMRVKVEGGYLSGTRIVFTASSPFIFDYVESFRF